jgi:hypothetical protein
MYFPSVSMGRDGSISEKLSLGEVFSLMTPGTSEMFFGKHINHFSNNLLSGAFAGVFSLWPKDDVPHVQKILCSHLDSD